MARRNRDTLKAFFKKGALPSEEQFHDFIDSVLNTIDEGFSKSPEKGYEISSVGNYDRLITFSRNDQPMWVVRYDEGHQTLLFQHLQGATLPLALAESGHVGVNQKEPAWPLDVGGVIRAEGRIGVTVTKETTVPADGAWHDITNELSGCQAFEVMAGVGKPRTGKYALMQAVAINTFNPKGLFFNFLNLKKRIRYHQAYYRSFTDKLKLRWFGTNQKYTLQLRSNSDYGDGVQIRYYLTRLWFDEDMSECSPQTSRKPGAERG
jgi:hypothetical protein